MVDLETYENWRAGSVLYTGWMGRVGSGVGVCACDGRLTRRVAIRCASGSGPVGMLDRVDGSVACVVGSWWIMGLGGTVRRLYSICRMSKGLEVLLSRYARYGRAECTVRGVRELSE